nr:unnamed protein product [Haemonchus contortus]
MCSSDLEETKDTGSVEVKKHPGGARMTSGLVDRNILKTAWENIPQEEIDKLIESMPRRCQAVIDARETLEAATATTNGHIQEPTYVGERQVIGNVFLADPCSIHHVCTPGKYTEERGNRHVYKVAQDIRKDSSHAGKKPAQVYLDMVAAPLEADNEEEEDSIRASIRRSGYQARRKVLANSVGVWVNRSVNMEHVPLDFRTLRDGSVFLQHHASGLHIYFSVATIKV